MLVTAAQSGKTDSMLDIIGSRLDQKPIPMLYAGPTQAFVTDQFEPRLMDLFDQSKSLQGKLANQKRNKKTQKWVGGVKIRLAHGGSSSALKSDPFGLAIVDEYDEMLADVKGQGDPLMLIEARGDTYADFTVGVASTPSRGTVDTVLDEETGFEFWRPADPAEVESGIWKLWQSGSRHHWAWPCPHCHEYFIPRFKQLRWPEGATPSRALREAYVVCPRCGGIIEEEHKHDMNERGRYVAPGQWIDTDGEVHGDPPDASTLSFWVSGLASPFRTFGQRAEAYLLAQESGDEEKIQTALNAGFGECSAPGAGDVPEWQEVQALRLPYHRRTVPPGVRFLTAGVDVQQNRLIYAIRGWGYRQESWLIDEGEIFGNTSEDDVWLELGDMLSDEIDGYRIRLAFVDSGYKPRQKINAPEHKVYEFCRLYPRLTRATKGYEVRSAPLTVSKIDVNYKGEKAKYSLEIMLVDTDYMKSFVHQRIRWPKDKPGGWHLHHDVTEEFCRQIVAEARTRKPNGRPEWVLRSRDNHFLDCEALAYAAAHMLGVHRLRKQDDEADDDRPRARHAVPKHQPEDDVPEETAPSAAVVRKTSKRQRFAEWAAHFNNS